MKKKHLAHIVTLISASLFLWPSLLSAQGGPEECWGCYCDADNTCTVGDCPSGSSGPPSNCASVQFTVTCGDDDYKIWTILTCPDDEQCKYCVACAYLYQYGAAGLLQSQHTIGCDEGWDCDMMSDPFTLQSSSTYVLYVCLRTCESASCTYCADCVARAYVFNNDFIDACAGIVCNP